MKPCLFKNRNRKIRKISRAFCHITIEVGALGERRVLIMPGFRRRENGQQTSF